MGPDGWPKEFLEGFIDLVGKDLLLVVEESTSSSKVLREINSTFLTSIPKKDVPESYGYFRPISLCNVVYKIISKTVARILKPVPSHLK